MVRPGDPGYYRHHGVSAEGEDAQAAEHDAHQVEEDAQLARLGAPLRELARWRGVQTWGQKQLGNMMGLGHRITNREVMSLHQPAGTKA